MMRREASSHLNFTGYSVRGRRVLRTDLFRGNDALATTELADDEIANRSQFVIRTAPSGRLSPSP
jgi:hypothetical protein